MAPTHQHGDDLEIGFQSWLKVRQESKRSLPVPPKKSTLHHPPPNLIPPPHKVVQGDYMTVPIKSRNWATLPLPQQRAIMDKLGKYDAHVDAAVK